MLHSLEPQIELPDLYISDPTQDRYARLRLIRWWNQDRLKSARVLVVGAGALGNEVLKNLALLGVGNVFVVDLDAIELSNLSRSVLFRQKDIGSSKAEVAARSMVDLNPDIQVKGMRCDVVWDIGIGLVRRMNVVVGCLDNREARLALNRLCWRAGTPWVDGGIDEFVGLARVFSPPDGPCYECTLSEVDYEFLNVRYRCPQIDPESIISGSVPTTPTVASIVGAIQAQEALKVLHGLDNTSLLVGRGLRFDGLHNTFDIYTYPRVETCLSHETYDGIIELPLASAYWQTREFASSLKTTLGVDKVLIELRHEILLSLDCLRCGVTEEVLQPLHQVSFARYPCPTCQAPRLPDSTCYVDPLGRLAQQRLIDLGVALGDVLIVRSQQLDSPLFVELSGDIGALLTLDFSGKEVS